MFKTASRVTRTAVRSWKTVFPVLLLAVSFRIDDASGPEATGGANNHVATSRGSHRGDHI
jgi:hypothetical protein